MGHLLPYLIVKGFVPMGGVHAFSKGSLKPVYVIPPGDPGIK